MQPAVFKSIESKELPWFPGFLHCGGSRDTCWFQPTTWSQVGQDPKLLASPKKKARPKHLPEEDESPFPELKKLAYPWYWTNTVQDHNSKTQNLLLTKKNAGLQDPTPRIVKCLIPFGNVPIILNLRGVKLESHQLWSPWGWWCYRNAMVRSLSAVCGGIPVSLSWGQLHRNRMLKNFKIFVFLDPQRFFLQRSVDPPFKNKRSMNYLESSQTYPQN